MIRFDVYTVFPDLLSPYLSASVLGRARQAGLLEVHLHDPRQFTLDRHRTTDDVPYGGGGGMVMKPEPIFRALPGALGSWPRRLAWHFFAGGTRASTSASVSTWRRMRSRSVTMW